jgi:hypothetical protein
MEAIAGLLYSWTFSEATIADGMVEWLQEHKYFPCTECPND